MNSITTRRAAGALLVLVPVSFSVCFTLLQQQFEYPDILRQPTADVLAKFAAGGPSLVATWYVLTITALAFVPVTLLAHRVLAVRGASTVLTIGTAFGVMAGVFQTLGFLRWPFVVPHLAATYLDPKASEAQRAAAGVVFEAFHRYAGMGVGEHLGYLCTSLWTLLIAVVLLRTLDVPRWLPAIGAVLAFGIAAGLLEPAGWEPGGAINAIAYLAWAVWLMAVGVVLVVRPAPEAA